MKITDISAFEALDSRGNPTVCAKVTLENGVSGKAYVPSGASTGKYEAQELRDQDAKRFLGKGVLKAISNVNGPIKALLIGEDVYNQARIDALMIEKDGTENKSKFGANAILAVSLACARAAAHASHTPLYKYIGGTYVRTLPCPMLNIINGGAHADNGLDFQEFMIRPCHAKSFSEAMRQGVEVFHNLKKLLQKKGYATNVGDEGGFAPGLSSHEEALDLICEAIQLSGFIPGKQISIALDCAATELFDTNSNTYIEKKRKKRGENGQARSSAEQIAYLEKLVSKYPIDSIEDGLAEEDWAGWKELTARLGNSIQLVGDDLFVTNPSFIARGVKEKCSNSVLIKVNQIGTLSETIEAVRYAQNHGMATIISHRSGETEDTFIADLVVALSSGQIKTGAPSRSDRVAKYNRLLEIEHELGTQAIFVDSNRFKK